MHVLDPCIRMLRAHIAFTYAVQVAHCVMGAFCAFMAVNILFDAPLLGGLNVILVCLNMYGVIESAIWRARFKDALMAAQRARSDLMSGKRTH